MPQLPAGFTFSYNGVTFGAYSNFRASMEPISDQAGRTVICLHFVIHADVTITTVDAVDTDTSMVTIQRMLSEYGGRLTIDGLGIGDMDINAPGGSVWDVNWGPKCTMGEWFPLGNNLAAQVPITIETWIPVCSSAVYQNQIMAFNYEVEWNITDGLTTRTITGYLEIPITRWNGQGSRTVPDVADDYTDRLRFEVPLGFRRRPIRRRLSDDRKRLFFTITDEELDSDLSPPVGAIEIETTQVEENEKSLVTDAVWVGSISSRVRGTRGARRSDIAAACVRDITERLKKVKDGQKPNGTGMVTGLLIRKWRFIEEWYKREFGIEVIYQFVGSLDTIFAQSGFWTTVPSSNWPGWRTSMANAFRMRGHADLAYHAQDDSIIDLCSSGEPITNMPSGDEPRMQAGTFQDMIRGEPPSPDETWIDYRCDLIHQRHESTVTHKISQQLPPSISPGPREWLDPNSTAEPRIGIQDGIDDVAQSLSTPTYRVFLVGTATRVKYRIPKPELLRVNGIDATRFVKHGADIFVEQTIGRTPWGPIYKAVWCIEYAPLNAPAGVLSCAPNHKHFIPHTFP